MRTSRAISVSAVALVLGCHQPVRPQLATQSPGLQDTVLDLQITKVPTTVQLTAALGGDSLVYIVFHNAAAVPDTIIYGGCAFAARIWNGPNFTQLAWQSVPPPGTYACPDFLAQLAIPASDSARMIAARLAAVPPDIGPPPTYGDVRAYINANGQLLELDAGIRSVPAVRGDGPRDVLPN